MFKNMGLVILFDMFLNPSFKMTKRFTCASCSSSYIGETFVKPKYTVYFDSFGIEHIPKEINEFIRNDVNSYILRLQAYDSIIEFINYMVKSKTLLDYTNLFSPNDFKKNDQTIKRIFKK